MHRLTAASLALITVAVLCPVQSAAFECVDYNNVLQEQGAIATAQFRPSGFQVLGDAAYAFSPTSAFVAVYDVSDPTDPIELAPLDLPAAPTGLAVGSAGLLVTVPGGGLVRYDLADPFAPVALDTLDLGVELTAVAVDGDLAVVSTGGGVRAVSIHPFGMVAAGSVSSPSIVTAVDVDGARLYLATYRHGLRVYDASNPSSLIPVGFSAYPVQADRVEAAHGLAVVTGPGSSYLGWTVAVYDVTGDEPPRFVADTEVARGFYYGAPVTVTAPDRLVVASSGGGLYRFRIEDGQLVRMGYVPGKHHDYHEDPSRYLVLSEQALSIGVPGPFPPDPVWADGAGEHMILRDDLIYSTSSGRFRIVDVGDPAASAVIGGLDLYYPDNPRFGLALHGSALYSSDQFESVDIVDVQDPAAPTLIDRLTLPTRATAMLADTGVLYVLMAGWGMATYDLTDPFAPQTIATTPMALGTFRGLVKLGDELLVATESSGVDIYDTSDPAAVTKIGNLPGRQSISYLALAGNRLLVADRVDPVQVWRREPDPGGWTLLGEIPASGILRATTTADVGYLLNEYGEILMLDLAGADVPEVFATLPTSYTTYSDLVAGDGWLSVRWGPYHRFYPAPCLLDPTAIHDTPAPAAPNLTVAPNPFNPSTRISFAVDRPGDVVLRVFDLRGRLVATLIDEPLAVGRHHADWRGTDGTGRPAPSGIYHVRLTAAGVTVGRKLTLLK